MLRGEGSDRVTTNLQLRPRKYINSEIQRRGDQPECHGVMLLIVHMSVAFCVLHPCVISTHKGNCSDLLITTVFKFSLN